MQTKQRYFKSKNYVTVFSCIIITMNTFVSNVKPVFSEHCKMNKNKISCIGYFFSLFINQFNDFVYNTGWLF